MSQAMKLLVIGGVAAGASCAARARRLCETAEITVLERGPDVSFANCGLPYHVGGEIPTRDVLAVQTPATLKGLLNLDVRTRCEAVRIDRAGKRVEAKNLVDGSSEWLSYDKLMLSPGASPILPPIPGIDSPHVLLCKNWDHAIAIKEKAKTAKSAVVIGSGYIGAEIAEQFSVTGVKTTLVDGLDRPLANNFDKTITDQVAAAFEEHGVTLALGQKVVEFRDNDDDTVTVVTENVQRLCSNCTCRYIKYTWKLLSCDLIHVRDH